MKVSSLFAFRALISLEIIQNVFLNLNQENNESLVS